MAIIALSGYAGSGKNTVALIAQYLMTKDRDISIETVLKEGYEDHSWWLDDQSGWEQVSFASKLKLIASILTGIPVVRFEDQEFKKTYLGSEWNYILPKHQFDQILGDEKARMTVREFLQKLGTEAIRNGLHPQAWVNATMSEYKPTITGNINNEPKIPSWIITDTRFLNEAEAIKQRGGIIIRVNRDVYPNDPITSTLHPSETSLDNYPFDYTIDNNSDLNNLISETEKMLKYFNFLS